MCVSVYVSGCVSRLEVAMRGGKSVGMMGVGMLVEESGSIGVETFCEFGHVVREESGGRCDDYNAHMMSSK
jgi:hypothetical protein